MKSLLLVVLSIMLAVSVSAQQFVAKTAALAYYVDSVQYTGRDQVAFAAIHSSYSMSKDGKIVLDDDNFQITTIIGNCSTFKYRPMNMYGRRNGERIGGFFERKIFQAFKPQFIFFALETVCKNNPNTKYASLPL